MGQDSRKRAVALPVQPLQRSLSDIGALFGVTVIASSDLVADRTARALEDDMNVDEALRRVLAGSNLSARRSASGAYVITQSTVRVEPARTRPEDEGLEADTIIVTGTKRGLSLQQTQTSVEVYSQERIEKQALFTIDDVLLRTPNVSASNAQTNFAIRGVSQTGVGFAGTGRTSNIYVDGAPLTPNGEQGAQSLWDVGQVEVLRGPQSTVQGRNALAGAIVIETNDPTYDWEVRARGQAATQESYRGSAVINAPIIDDQLAVRFAFDYQTYDNDVVEVTTGTPQEFQDSFTYRGKILFEPDALPGFRAVFKAERIDTEFGEFNTRFAPVPFNDPAIDDFDEFGRETFTRVRLEDAETDLYVLDISQKITDNWTLTGIGAFENQNRITDFCSTVAGDCLFTGQTSESEQYSGELRAQFDYGKLSGWIGGYYFNQEITRILDFSLPASGAGFPVNFPDTIVTVSSVQGERIENYAIFGDFTYEVNEKWSVNFGARYDWEDFVDTGQVGEVTVSNPDCIVSAPFGDVPCAGLAPVTTSPERPTSFSAFLPRGAITYNFDDLRSISFIAQRGYRAGGSVFQVLPGQEPRNVAFGPEFVTNYELAFRSQWLDQRLTLNANAFYMDWSDQQITIPGPSGNPLGNDGFVDNAGASRLFGLELSSNYQATEAFDVFASLGLLNTEFTDFEFVPTEAESPFNNLAGNRFPVAPTVSASLGVNYKHPSGAYTNWSASYQSGRESDVTNISVNRVPDYVLVNARVGYRFDNVNIYAFASNLFDERFSTRNEFANINPATGALNVFPNARFQVNEPRVAGISAEVAF